ncbi:type I polyketide synthase [Caballeronia sp. LZ035]|uniref:type I polyketide synthase n=1 Tax=Caballeronia sp. LZ035 TaxID=3038568 RepID=UPI002864EEAC|nr:type I polyketide synthase [Caballeronia sp. LZ035]MDR5757599.1 type I polyketide synthase [Caballeronia sp. LZ035]
MTQKIAIIGMSCRLPGGVTNTDDLWNLLVQEKDAVTEIPADRFGTDFYQHPSKQEPGKSYTFSAGILDHVAGFDAQFFGISPREAAQMDPQQRLLLELAWEAFEDAGVRPADMKGRNCAVFVGVASTDYGNRSMDDLSAVDPYSATGSTMSIAANRVSYLYDLRGPSMSIDTACSSSLVALHQACGALASGEAETALAGGVNMLLHPFGFVSFAKASMLSPTGRCRAFDSRGDGYVRSEGGAFVMLKTLSRALADGDTIHAVISGSGVNSDGFTQGGISVPGAATQAALLRRVYADANVLPAQLAYVEAHGTGTQVGDPIETRALLDVAGAGREADAPLLIGSVKTNLGHLETASGMAGLLKAVLVLKHRAIPRSLHFVSPNPKIDFGAGRMRVVDRFTPLESGSEPLHVGVNSFGFGGTNAHVVLSEAPPAAPQADEHPPATGFAPLMLSARSNAALAAQASRYLNALDAGTPWSALAAGAARRRQWMEQRAIVAPASLDEAREALGAFAASTGSDTAAIVTGQASQQSAPLALVYSGNGAQWAGMGQRLMKEDAAFAEALREVDALWCADGSPSLAAMLEAGVDADTLAATEIAQPLLFAMQVGITRAIAARGVRYVAACGHSVGEIAAAWAAGALTLEQAVRVIRIRSGAQALTRGSGLMAAAGISEEAAAILIAQLDLAERVEIAGINSPQAVTLAGDPDALLEIQAALGVDGTFFRMLTLDYAFHSRHMDAIQSKIESGLSDLKPGAAARRFVSTVTGATLDGTQLDAAYWWRNVRDPVRFASAIGHLAERGIALFLEVGPHAILRSYVDQTLKAGGFNGARALITLKRNEDHAVMLRRAVLNAVAHGAPVEVDRFAPPAARTALPTYPWQRETFWRMPTPESYDLVNRKRAHPLLGYRLSEHALAWGNQIDPARIAFLNDHVVDGAPAFPGAGYIEMALAAGREFMRRDDCALENLEIHVPLVFQAGVSKRVRFVIDPATARFRIETRDRMSDDPWALNASGRFLQSGPVVSRSDDLSGLLARDVIDADQLYAQADRIGLSYGPAFRWVRDVRIDGERAFAHLSLPVDAADVMKDADAFAMHPALIDAGFHPLFALLGASGKDHAAYVPVQIGRIDFLRTAEVCAVIARIDRRSPHSVLASFDFVDADHHVVMRLSGCRFRRVDLLGRRHVPPARLKFIARPQPLDAAAGSHTLPAPAALIARALDALTALSPLDATARRQSHLTETLPLFDVLASAYALRALEGIDDADASNERLHHALERMLLEDGLLIERDGHLARDEAACADWPAADELWRSLLASSPAHVAELTLLAHRGAQLPALLASDSAEAPSSTRDALYEHYLDASPTWAHANRVLEQCVTQAVLSWTPARRIRVLEIAAPDAQFIHGLDVALPGERCERVLAGTFAQVQAFDPASEDPTRTAVISFGDAPSLEGERGPFDVIVARRAPGAPGTQEASRKLLEALRGWLAPGGIVVMAEPQRGRFSELVFDTASGVPAAQLEALFEAAGFEHVTREIEHDIDLESVPAIVVARKPLDMSQAEGVTPRGTWWIAGSEQDSGFEAALCRALTSRGQAVTRVSLADAALRLHSLEHAPHLVFVAPQPADSTRSGEAMLRAQDATALALAAFVRDAAATHNARMPQLNVVTHGAAPVALPAEARSEDASLAHGTLWGLTRTLANEHPEMACRLIDLQQMDDASAAHLADELLAALSDDAEEEVVLTAAGRYVSRMLPADAKPSGAEAETLHARLGFEAPGSLRHLQWLPLPERELADDEVEIEPAATGLNFRDVMYAMGLLSDEAVENGFAGATIGMELSGRVTRAGRKVTHLQAGDAVLGFASASFASRVQTRADAVAKKPGSMSFEEAATIPTAFFTAYYALVELARVRRGERVLIHGGAGGVGIAAIQLARHLGAEVFASAGSREKREFVRLVGAEHVLDSRSLAFADDVRALTNGEGIDIVLNSLAGEAMVRGIDTLRPFGRFLELGKRDFYENSQIGLRPFRNNISYFGIDADQLMSARPDLTARLFADVMALFAEGALHPLPYRAFAAREAEAAFRTMQQARQIGKVLVTYPHGTPQPKARPTAARASFKADASYLIIGGTGGFGFATARWMIERGARHMVLASRSGRLDAEQAEGIAQLTASTGARIDVRACNVSSSSAVDALIAWINQQGRELKGIVHSAMHIDDGLLRNLDDARMRAVFAPKVAGAWNLHRATLGMALDCFVLYSSATTYLGNPGQSSYVAANTFLETLVEWRRAQGLCGTVMAWGPLDDVGFLARNGETKKALQGRIGGGSITSTEALAALDRAIADKHAGEAVLRLDWQVIARGMPAASARRYRELSRGVADEGALEGGAQLRDQVRELPVEDAQAQVETVLQAQIARILHLSPEKIVPCASVLELGMDSLMGIELGMAVEETLGVKLSVMAIAEGATVSSLAARIVADIKGAQDAPAEADVAGQVNALAARHALDVSKVDGVVQALQADAAADGAANRRSVEERA